MKWLLKTIVGTKNERDLKKIRPIVARINELEEAYQALSEDELKAKTLEFKERLTKGETVDDILPEAFAVVKNASRRLCGQTFDVCDHPIAWEMVPFDVQLIGGIVLHKGLISEMATGEGKTLVATMPAYLNALTGNNVHIVTVNDYLARRDSEWMGAIYEYLGITVGCIQNSMMPDVRRLEYEKDITYGTNSEFGFDYLRDNGMAFTREEVVQRGHFFAIIDEVDSILIDEARTPLIISGPAPHATNQYAELRAPVERLYKKQRDFCNRLIRETDKLLKDGEEEEAQLKLYQVHQGMPKNKQLAKILEEPSYRKLSEQINAQMLTDMRKEEARALREELFFMIDEKGHDASLTDKGCEALSPHDPDAYVLPDLIGGISELEGEDSALSEQDAFEEKQALQTEFAEKSERIHNVDQLIRAYCLYEKDVEYVVQNNQVLIVDEYTGRLMPGRRWSDGLHQAVEAKEGVKIERETQTLATITIQNYFRLYEKLSGMTGTAETEADEFAQIYKLDVLVIPTNRPVRRVDANDLVYKTHREKYQAIIEEVKAYHDLGMPVLVGTISVETSELLSRKLKQENVPHHVLNAKQHASEAEVVARAGQQGAVTIATNMAGRGTDIKLGEGVVHLSRELLQSGISLEDKIDGTSLRKILEEKPSGLHVVCTERHESRRIDRQLRGRCARQGDPGSSRFYVSLEDDLMRLFGSERISGIMEKLGIGEGEVLEHPWLNRSIERAQRKVEEHNFSIRKRTLEYDDVMNSQRDIIYTFRREVVTDENVREHLYSIVDEVVHDHAESMLGGDEENSADPFLEWVNGVFPIGITREDLPDDGKNAASTAAFAIERVHQAYTLKIKVEDPNALESMERHIILQAIDQHWQEYLRGMDTLRQGVGLRAYGQRDPLVEYKKEAYEMFAALMDQIKLDIVHRIFRSATNVAALESFLASLPQMNVHDEVHTLGHGEPVGVGAGSAPPPPGADQAMQAAMRPKGTPVRREDAKVGRNDPCPCGSGKKYKKCCGAG